jgi:sugar phosphate isomerase/epimerase
MKIENVAAQLYTVRHHLQTPAGIAASLKKIRAIGFQAVELAGLGRVEDAEVVRMLGGEGLTCCATHESGETILDDPPFAVDRLQQLGCRYASFPHPGGVDMNDARAVRELAHKLDKSGALLRGAGCVLAYHNHALEWRRAGDKLAIEIIFEETDPQNLQAEMDTYWVQYGGGDPVDWCRRLAGRLPLVHLKDYGITRENQPNYCEIGRGTLNFREIISAAEASGCEWFIVEQDECPGDPFDSLKQSFDYISARLV